RRPAAGRRRPPGEGRLAARGRGRVHGGRAARERLSGDTAEVWRGVAADGAAMALRYAPVVEPGGDVAATRERLLAALADSRRSDLQRGVTLVGPHPDDLVIRLGRAERRAYAARGEPPPPAAALAPARR